MQLETVAESDVQATAARWEVVQQVFVARGQAKNDPAFFDALPLEGYNYATVIGAFCENILKCMTVPLEIAAATSGQH